MRVLALVPAFNEASNLPGVLADLAAAARRFPHDSVVIDDGSSDGTAAVASGLGALVLRSPINLGIGGAVQTGYLWARQHAYDIAVQLDGDGQHDPAEMEALAGPILQGRADLVVGSRFLATGGFRSTALRRAGIGYLSALLRLRCGGRFTDPTSGFRAAGPRALALFAASYPSDYPEPESLAVATRAGLRVVEVPARMRDRAHGRSSIGALRTVYYLLKVTLAILLLPIRGSTPARAEEGAA